MMTMTTATPLDVFTCELDGINLIEASAGTGKTWNICGLYLRLLLERQLEVQQILVVTFTNAATAELRDRIRSRLADMRDHLNGKTSKDAFILALAEMLENRHNIGRDALLQRLELALQTFDEASIFTIHGFCQRALADAAFAAGQAFTLELSPDDSELLLEVVHDFWREHIAGETMDATLAACLLQQKDTPQKFARLLKRHLAKPLASIKWPETQTAMPDSAALANAYAAAQAGWSGQRGGIIEKLDNSLNLLHKGSYNEKSIQAAVSDYDAFLRAGDPLAGKLKDTKLHLLCSSNLEKRTTGKNTPPEHDFFKLAETLLSEREALEQTLQLARLNLIRRMIESCTVEIRSRKRERRLLAFDDILHNLYAALTSGDNPWLATSLLQRFPAALVDEFQDTDPLQFAIFDAIYGAGEHPLFLVGDPKQAIYRFRNADLDTYLAAKDHASATYSIKDNQRSSANLIGALNQLFAANPRAFMLPGLDFVRAGVGQKPRKVLDDRSGQPADLQLWLLPGGDEMLERRAAKQHAVNATAAEIARLLNAASDSRAAIDGKPLQAGDIAVLVRSHRQGSDIRRALLRLGVGSIELSQESVFASLDAEEVERVLAAIWSPSRLSLLRAALATELLGLDAAGLAAISAHEALLMQRIRHFADYRELWLTRGIGVAYRRLLSEEGISARMLRRPDGERRMTNLLHLGELLHQAAEQHPSPDALLRWLQTQRSEKGADEAAQLRLESDQNLVQILTIHKSKGLEFPVVFCPFLWDGHRSSRNNLEGREYHDEHGQTVIDYRHEAGDDKAIKGKIRLESDAEDLRLIYVALTRAVHRCYLIAGAYATSSFGRLSTTESTRSLLNWLAAGSGQAPEHWCQNKLPPAEIDQSWRQLAAADGGIVLSPLPLASGQPYRSEMPAPETLVCQPWPSLIPAGWRISSYSGLSRGAVHDNAASEHDLQLPASPAEPMPPGLPAGDILRFPKGANAGDCIHKVFERCDFVHPASWPNAIERALAEHPQAPDDVSASTEAPNLAQMLQQMTANVLATPLPDGIVLSNILQQQRLTELGFHLPTTGLSATALNQSLQTLGYPSPRLSFNELRGYLKGFIDLVFKHDGRYYILDWKSNHLGHTQRHYDDKAVGEAMAQHGYHLQYLLYTIALDRYLARRVRGYHYDTHFGGVLYLFVRGVRPEWPGSGVYFHRPEEKTIRQLAALFAAAESAEAA
ncbi:MAG: recB [Burkholderiaceae bacterium]|nr:recB [Burkholderiaceae bacterium]